MPGPFPGYGFLLEDGTTFHLLEDGTSFLLLEGATPPVHITQSLVEVTSVPGGGSGSAVVSSAAVEALNAPGATEVDVTASATEVLNTGDARVQVSQVFIEILTLVQRRRAWHLQMAQF